MQYPHWLIVAGAALSVLGLVGLAFRQPRERQVDERSEKAR